MAFTYKAAAVKSTYTAGNVATIDPINVAVGDLIVVGLCSNTGGIVPTGLADTANNTWIALDTVTFSNAILKVYYCVATIANAADYFTGSFTATSATKSVRVAVFTPDVGDSVLLDFSVTGGSSSEATPWETTTGNMAANASDALGIAYFFANAAMVYGNQLIGGLATTVLTPASTSGTYFYRMFSAPANGVGATVTVDLTKSYAARLLMFKSVGGTELVAPKLSRYNQRRRIA